ncbi:MAG: 50S ribosomal protein L11 methyltransferase [Pseudomonadota bacterium]
MSAPLADEADDAVDLGSNNASGSDHPAPQRRLRFLELDRETANGIAGVLTQIVEPAPTAVSIFEVDPFWQVDAYFENALADEPAYAETVLALLQTASDASADHCDTHSDAREHTDSNVKHAFEDVPDENWVALSQASLPPVEAGRFVVHGAHNRDRFGRQLRAIEIDAGEAFGTAHHATTFGCLVAIDRLGHTLQPRRILDLGTGSGVLAIAARRIWPNANIVASDIDGDAVRVSRENVAKNRAPAITVLQSNRVPSVKQSGAASGSAGPNGYDLVIANILAGPLIKLSSGLAPKVQDRGTLVLSGILNHQARQVAAAYHQHGFRTVQHDRVTGWSILTMQKRPGRSVPIQPLMLLD